MYLYFHHNLCKRVAARITVAISSLRSSGSINIQSPINVTYGGDNEGN